MIHQPYEDWLLANPARPDAGLSAEQSASLRDHLDGCDACRSLASALDAMEDELHNATVAAPEPGFTRRWQARLEEQRALAYRRQSVGAFALSISIALVLLGAILAISWPIVKSPGMLGLIALYQASRLAMLVESSQHFLAGLARSAGVNLSWVVWALAVGVVCQMAVLWLVSYRMLTNPRRVSK